MFDDGNFKKTINSIHLYGWKYNYLDSVDLSMMEHNCGASKILQLYDKTINIYVKLSRLFVGSYDGE